MDAAGNLSLRIYSSVRETCVNTIPQSILSVAGAAGRRGFVSHCGFLLGCSKISPSDWTSALLAWERITRPSVERSTQIPLGGHVSTAGSDWEGGLSQM